MIKTQKFFSFTLSKLNFATDIQVNENMTKDMNKL